MVARGDDVTLILASGRRWAAVGVSLSLARDRPVWATPARRVRYLAEGIPNDGRNPA
jgi:hypothetical protein